MKFKDILEELEIDETFNKEQRTKKANKKYNSVDENITHEAKIQFQADVLHLPKTTQGNKYLLIVVDIATRTFDIEPMKILNSESCLEALKQIQKRKYIGELKAPLKISTDGGAEFQKDVKDYLWKKNIFHRVTSAGRSNQLSIVNSLCKELGRLFMGYLNKKNEENVEGVKKIYSDWDKIVNTVRIELNKFRRVQLPKNPTEYEYNEFNFKAKPKFHQGDLVHRRLDKNEDVFGYKWSGYKSRAGDYTIDKSVKKIEKVIYMNDEPYHRYILEGLPNIAFYDYQLIKSDALEPTYILNQFIDRRTNKTTGELEYLLQFRGETEKQAIKNQEWQTLKSLLKQGLDIYIKAYDKDHPIRPTRNKK